MKKTFLYLAAVPFIVTLLFSGCKKDAQAGAQGLQGPAGPSYTGTIKGFVSLFDPYGSKLFSPALLKGIKVTLENNGQTVTTDSTGKYSFINLSTGNYTLSFADSGFGSDRVLNAQ